jgi:hypothetical protein
MVLPELAEDIDAHSKLIGTSKKSYDDAIKELDSIKMTYL